MTPTSDERREVARMLRWFASLHGNVACVTVERTLGLDYSDGFGGGAVTSESVRRLADLIDPTCNMSVEEVSHRPTLNAMAVCVYECDRCHAVSYIGDVCCYPEPRYCPYCGARVVSGDGE